MRGSSVLFSPIKLGRLELKNRVTMAPMFVGYAGADGLVTDLLLEHYREMAASGAALIVVENAAINTEGLGSPFTLRVDGDQFIEGLSRLARVIRDEGALAILQINHAGRYAFAADRVAPSPYLTYDVVPREMSVEDIQRTIQAYALGARVVKEAGFDGVELHGGTGYLLVQFLSSRTNLRTDDYGGPLENRMRFPLEVVDAVLEAVGGDYPVGYRFLADECLPEGLRLEETSVLARELGRRGLTYLSVMAGTYDSFFLPEYLEKERNEGYMVSYAAAIKKVVPDMPVITAGRIESPETAERILKDGDADLVGLARVLFADPLWPKKAAGIIPGPIVKCEPTCSLCTKRVIRGKPAFCSQWDKERREAFRIKFQQSAEDMEGTD